MSIEIMLLIGFVMFALMLIGAGIYLDNKKRKEVNLMVETGKNYVRCNRCSKWTELKASSMFDGFGVLCASCSKVILIEPSFTSPAVVKPRKRSLLMTLIKGVDDNV